MAQRRPKLQIKEFLRHTLTNLYAELRAHARAVAAQHAFAFVDVRFAVYKAQRPLTAALDASAAALAPVVDQQSALALGDAAHNVLRGVYIDGLGHMSREDFSEIEAVAATPATAALMRRSYQTDEDLDAVTAQHNSVQKIIAFFRNPDDKQATIHEITARFPGYAVSSSLGNNIEINAQNATKGSALCFLCEKIGVPIGQCMAFGDGTNDYSMLRAAGFGVAMGNASEEVQSCADAVTETNEEDGVAHMIERVLEL